MADGAPDAAATGAEDLVRRMVDANVSYYRAWGSLVTDWLTELTEVARAAPGVVSLQTPPAPRTSSPAPAGHRHAPPAPPPTPAAVLVLEGPAGTQAAGAFEVENVLDAEAAGVVVVDPFRDPAGQPVGVDVVVAPERLELAPGQSVVVSLRATVPEAAAVGVDHRSTVRVEGIPAGTIAVVLRRLET